MRPKEKAPRQNPRASQNSHGRPARREYHPTKTPPNQELLPLWPTLTAFLKKYHVEVLTSPQVSEVVRKLELIAPLLALPWGKQ